MNMKMRRVFEYALVAFSTGIGRPVASRGHIYVSLVHLMKTISLKRLEVVLEHKPFDL